MKKWDSKNLHGQDSKRLLIFKRKSENSQRFQRKVIETNKGRMNAAFILYFSVSDPLPGTTIASYSYRIAGARLELASGG